METTARPIGRHMDTQIAAVIAAFTVALIALFFYDPAYFLIVPFVGLLVLMVVRFDVFVYSTIFLMPWYPIVTLGLPIRDVFLLLRFVLFAGIWYGVRKEHRSVAEWLFGSKLKKAIVALAAVGLISVVVSAVPFNVTSVRALVRLYSYIAIFFALDGFLQRRLQLVTAIKAMLVSTIAVDLFGFFQTLSGGYTDIYFRLYPTQEDSLVPWEGRITSLLFHYNALAGYLNLVFPFAVACAVLGRDYRLRALGWVCAILTLPAMILTQSRGGLAAMIVVILLMVWLLFPRLTTRIKILALATVVGVFLVPSILQHFERLEGIDDATTGSRLILWQTAATLFVQNPVLGVGYGNYRALAATYVPGAEPGMLDAHNVYLQTLAEMGIIGFAVFFGILTGLIWLSRIRLRRGDPIFRIAALGLVGAIVSLFIHGFVDFLFIVSPQFGGMFWLVLSIGYASARLASRSQPVAEAVAA